MNQQNRYKIKIKINNLKLHHKKVNQHRTLLTPEKIVTINKYMDKIYNLKSNLSNKMKYNLKNNMKNNHKIKQILNLNLNLNLNHNLNRSQ